MKPANTTGSRRTPHESVCPIGCGGWRSEGEVAPLVKPQNVKTVIMACSAFIFELCCHGSWQHPNFIHRRRSKPGSGLWRLSVHQVHNILHFPQGLVLLKLELTTFWLFTTPSCLSSSQVSCDVDVNWEAVQPKDCLLSLVDGFNIRKRWMTHRHCTG